MQKQQEHGTSVHPLSNNDAPQPTDPWTEFPGLKPDDFEAMRLCDPATGHLLKYDPATGAMDSHSINILNEKGLLQRLVSHGLIVSGGKLTAKGMRLCEELAPPDRAARPHPPMPEESSMLAPDEDIGGLARQRDSNVAPKWSEKIKKSRSVPAKVGFFRRENPAGTTLHSPQRSPHASWKADESLVAVRSPESHEAEQFKMLKTCILYPPSGTPPRSILVTSVDPGEGKSFIAANLSICIAQNLNQHVLLIDCDLRKPSLHHLFGFGEVPGLSEYLSESKPIPSLLQRTEAERLCILPAGRRPQNPAELLSSARMVALLKEVKSRYTDRLVVIDSPPSTMTAEPSVLARQVDGILMVIRYGSTRLVNVQKAVEQLGKSKVIGCVINQHEPTIQEYYGYKRYPGYGPSPSLKACTRV